MSPGIVENSAILGFRLAQTLASWPSERAGYSAQHRGRLVGFDDMDELLGCQAQATDSDFDGSCWVFEMEWC